MVHSQSINDYVFGMGHGARAQDGHGSIHAPRTRPDAWRGGALPPRGGHTAHTVARIGHLSHITCARSLLHTCVWHNPRQITLCDYTPTISFFFGKRGLFRMNQWHTGTRAEPQCARRAGRARTPLHTTRDTRCGSRNPDRRESRQLGAGKTPFRLFVVKTRPRNRGSGRA